MGVSGLFFLFHKRVTVPGQVAEFFKIGDGGEEDGDPVFFLCGSFVNLGGKFLIFDVQDYEGVKIFFLKGTL